jgi:hypothetical protein
VLENKLGTSYFPGVNGEGGSKIACVNLIELPIFPCLKPFPKFKL